MKIITTKLAGVLLLELNVHHDLRGNFAEIFVQSRYVNAGINTPFVQDNWSHSKKDTLRGLHLQQRYPQGKLITVCHGHIWDVVVDINPISSTFGEHVAVELYGFSRAQQVQQLWVPAGYAHGFCVLSDEASVLYKCTDTYHPEDETGVLWSDIDLGIAWPVAQPIVSARDQKLPTLKQWQMKHKPK